MRALPLPDWAEKFLVLPPGGYSVPGPLKLWKIRHLLKPLLDFQDERTRKQTFCKSPQSCGTLFAEICLAWAIKYRPGQSMLNMQIDPIALAHAKDRLFPMIKNCADLKDLWPVEQYDETNQRITFRNKIPLHVSGPAMSKLQSKSVRISANDEIFIWEPGRLEEAHTRVMAFKRDNKSNIINVSQAGVSGDDMDKETKDGSCEEWEVPCVHCGHFQVLEFNEKREDGTYWGLVWDGGSEPVYESIAYECRECRKRTKDTAVAKKYFNDHGNYRVTNIHAQPENKSYRTGALILMPWKDAVIQFLGATVARRNGVIIPLKTFIQKVRNRSFHEDLVTEKLNLKTVGYSISETWKDEAYRFMAVDCQMAHFWVGVGGFSAASDFRLFHYSKVSTWEELREVQKKHGVNDAGTFADCRFRTQEVYGQTAIYGWGCMRGEDKESFLHKEDGMRRLYGPEQVISPVIGKKSGELAEYLRSLTPEALERYKRGSLTTSLFPIAKPSLQDVLARRLKGEGPSFEIYDGVIPEFMEQLPSAELRTRHNKITGVPEEFWYEKRNDHSRDIVLMMFAAASMAEILGDVQLPQPTKEAA